MKKVLLLCCWLVTGFGAFAQQQAVTGTITDADDGSALPGVSVLIKGTANGTTTDADGRFSLMAESTDVLVLSFIGYESQEVSVGTQTNISVAMKASATMLGEVVVIGFGERERKDITGSIATVSAKDIETTPFASPQFALQGKVSGVRVLNSSGNPSAGPEIYVRGVGTWNGTSQPLYVIDGQIITPPSNVNQDVIGNINLWTLINPNDIESMSVLKDASAAAIYGSRAANGVVLITTKKGKKGKPVIEFNSQIGVQNIPTYDVLNGQEYVQINREIYTNSLDPNVSIESDFYGRGESTGELLASYSPQFDPESPFYMGENPRTYNWQDEVRQKNALNQNYNLKLSGASEATDYYLSLGYAEQESVLKGDNLERYNLALNLNTKVNKYVRAGLTYKITYQESQENSQMGIRDAAAAPVWQPLYDPENRFGFAPSRAFNEDVGELTLLYGAQTRFNPLALQALNFSDFNLIRNIGQAYLEVEPITGLKIRGGLSADFTYQQREQFEDVLQDEFLTSGGTGVPAGSFGRYGLRTNKFFNYQADLTASYNKAFGNHNVSATFVIQDQSFKNWTESFGTRVSRTRVRSDLGIPGGQGPGDQDGFAGLSTQKFWFSYVGRLGYNYDNKYYLDASYRRDGSNGFPEENRWGNFFSLAGAWRLSAENFMQDVDFIDDLKLRAGWGQTGNDEAVVGTYSFISRTTDTGSYSFGSGDGDAIGRYLVATSLSDLPNADIFWEMVSTTNIGLDASFLSGKFTSTIEYFNRVTHDVLQFVNIPLIAGTGNMVQNIGSLKNSGVELELGYNNRIGDLTYGISGNISFLRNEVTDLLNDAPLTVDMNGNTVRIEEGRSIGHIWGYRVGGIFKSQDEIDAYFATTPDETNEGNLAYIAPGDMYFLDVHGNPTDSEPYYSKTPDGVINNYDMTEIGKTIPGHTYGLNLSAGYKGLDLSVGFYGEGDVDKVNESRRSMEAMTTGGLNHLASVRNRYTPSNTNTSMPRAVAGDPAGNNRLSERWVEKAGFFRLNTWQLGYSVNSALLARTNTISRVRLFVGGQNNMVITNWTGLDPVNDQYPLPKSYFVGLNLTF